VTQDHDEARAKMRYRILDAAERVVIDQVARRPPPRKDRRGLVKDDLRTHARIGAPDDHRKRMLPLRDFRAAFPLGFTWLKLYFT